MPSTGNLRAADADRDRVAAALREHLAAGRLTTDEFEDRLDRTYAAKTLGDLAAVTADLPSADLEQLPGDPVAGTGEQPPGLNGHPGR
jgi:hypothetical protein